MEKTSTKSYIAPLIVAFLMLFNPNISIIDLLPDFVAWFILAHLFDRAADAAPHFEEARVNFIRLGLISLIRMPAFALVLFVKGKDPTDNNVITLVSFTLAAIEGILTFIAAKNTFLALFHLGERSDAAALIKPFRAPITKRMISTDALRDFTYFFFIAKALLFALPDMFLLTRVTEAGYVTAFSPYYPVALLCSHIIGMIIGAVWLIRTIGYATAIAKENKFSDALSSVAREGSLDAYEKKRRVRKTGSLLMIFAWASVFTVTLTLDNFDNIDILPTFLFGIITSFVIYKLGDQLPKFKLPFIFGLIYSGVALLDYIVAAIFLSSYEYADITRKTEALLAYIPVALLGVLHLIAFILFIIFTARLWKSFALLHTGTDPECDRYGKMESEFHDILIRRANRLSAIGISAAAARCANVFINAFISYSYTYKDDVPSLTVPVSVAPWFSVVVVGLSLFFVGYSLYFFSNLKDEFKMKYI